MKAMGDVIPIDEDSISDSLESVSASKEFGQRTLRSLKRGLGRIWRRHRGNVSITEYDPSYKVSYLGNVLTGWAKGKHTHPIKFVKALNHQSQFENN